MSSRPPNQAIVAIAESYGITYYQLMSLGGPQRLGRMGPEARALMLSLLKSSHSHLKRGTLMGVFVDDAFIPFGRMIMCHMIADTHDELLAMADKIDLNRKWIQKEGTYAEHFDVSKAYCLDAIANGAVAVSPRDVVLKMRDRQSEEGRIAYYGR